MPHPPADPLHWTPGQSLGTSTWMLIDQPRITAFGTLTNDLEPLHIDPEWSRQHSPVGSTIAYGFLTLSMLTAFFHEVTHHVLSGASDDVRYPLNYGFDRVRFVSPVPVNARIRGHFTFTERRARPDGELLCFAAVVEVEGSERPALTADWWTLWVTGHAAPGRDARANA